MKKVYNTLFKDLKRTNMDLSGVEINRIKFYVLTVQFYNMHAKE